MAKLDPEFFARDTLEVARDLIGVVLVVGKCKGRIVETEAYKTDAASHSVLRRHKAALMRETYAHVYVYHSYGVHFCMNFTTEREGTGAVLIRAAEPLAGLADMARRRSVSEPEKLASGPGKLCQAFGIGIELNGRPLGREIKLFAGQHAPIVACGPRIGITRAVELPWRFYELGNACVSRRAGRKPEVGGRKGKAR
ncbi:MAG TPA: DNA-3-methyladenine glycosylase [Pirellulales bacterium]|nr:DNA-3-methyladenine glycosylase [Pirellulales bacterium]